MNTSNFYRIPPLSLLFGNVDNKDHKLELHPPIVNVILTMTCHLSNQMEIGSVADNAIALKAIQYISCVPLQGENKTIFGCVKTNKLIFLVKVTLRSSFQQSAIQYSL